MILSSQWVISRMPLLDLVMLRDCTTCGGWVVWAGQNHQAPTCKASFDVTPALQHPARRRWHTWFSAWRDRLPAKNPILPPSSSGPGLRPTGGRVHPAELQIIATMGPGSCTSGADSLGSLTLVAVGWSVSCKCVRDVWSKSDGRRKVPIKQDTTPPRQSW